jgi:uncharacterized protein YdaU (DUF1376 family)
MAEFFWTAVEWEAYDRKTAHLSLAADGAYRRLLSHYYRTRKPLPANAEILLRVCRAFDDSEKAAVLMVVGEFFTLEDDGYHNRRADEELDKQAQVSEKRREAGKKGAETTNGKRAAIGSANERQLPTQLQSQLHKPPSRGDDQILQIAQAYPKLSHIKLETDLPEYVIRAITEAIDRDGYETVLAGTKKAKGKRAPYPFFAEGEYRQNLPKVPTKPTWDPVAATREALLRD